MDGAFQQWLHRPVERSGDELARMLQISARAGMMDRAVALIDARADPGRGEVLADGIEDTALCYSANGGDADGRGAVGGIE